MGDQDQKPDPNLVLDDPLPESSALELADRNTPCSPVLPWGPVPVPSAPPAAGPADPASASRTAAASAEEMQARYAAGDFSGALVVAEGLLDAEPGHAAAERCAQSCRGILIQMYASRFGSLHCVPRVVVPLDQIRWLSLDHRAGFLLSLVDGTSRIEDVLDICGMPRLDALRLLLALLEQRVIAVE